MARPTSASKGPVVPAMLPIPLANRRSTSLPCHGTICIPYVRGYLPSPCGQSLGRMKKHHCANLDELLANLQALSSVEVRCRGS
jgi:hypothetical protein